MLVHVWGKAGPTLLCLLSSLQQAASRSSPLKAARPPDRLLARARAWDAMLRMQE